MSGPYDTEAQARDEPMPQAVRGPRAGRETMYDIRLAFLLNTCEAAGVELGAHDRRKLVWLAGWESDTVQVLGDLMARAYEAGKAAGAPSTEEEQP